MLLGRYGQALVPHEPVNNCQTEDRMPQVELYNGINPSRCKGRALIKT